MLVTRQVVRPGGPFRATVTSKEETGHAGRVPQQQRLYGGIQGESIECDDRFSLWHVSAQERKGGGQVATSMIGGSGGRVHELGFSASGISDKGLGFLQVVGEPQPLSSAAVASQKKQFGAVLALGPRPLTVQIVE